jgi:hypothetical protein
MSIEDSIFQGNLGLKRKKGFESRFFLLFSDRLDYYRNEAEIETRAEPRGRLNLEDIKSIQFSLGDGETNIVIELVEQSVELSALEDNEANLSEWHQAFQKVLPEGIIGDAATDGAERNIILEGELFVVRKGTEIPRHFVLMSDCIEYYADRDARDSGNEARGRVMLQDISRFESVVESLSVFIEAADEKRPLVLKSANKTSFKDWAKEWEALLAGPLGDNFVVTEDSAQTTPRSALPGPAVTAAQTTPRSALPMPEPSPSPGYESHVVIDSPIGIVKKDRAEARHGVLWSDRFEYYNTEQEFQNDSQPRCRIPLDQFIGFEESGDTFVIQLEDRGIAVQIARDPSLLKQWSKAWSDVGIGEARPTPPMNPGPAIMSSSTAKSGTPRKSVGGTLFIKQGEIQLLRKDQRETRHLAVTSEQLQIYNSAQEVLASAYPRMRIIGSDIADVKPFDKGFVVELQNAQELEFECATQDEVNAWVAVIKPLQRNVAAAKRLSQGNAAARLVERKKADEHLMEGTAMIVLGGGGKPQRQLFRIYEDCFEYANDAVAIERPAETTSQPLRGVQSVDGLANGQGFIIRLEVGGTIEMRVTTKDKQRWREAWQTFMGNKPAAATPRGATPTPIVGREGSQKNTPRGQKKANSSPLGVMHEGVVGVAARTQRGTVERKYLVLSNTESGCKMKIFANMDPRPDESPTEEVSVAEIVGIKVDEDGLAVSTASKEFKFKILDGPGSVNAWEAAFRNACTLEADGGRSPRSPQAPRNPRAASESPTRERFEAEANWLKDVTAGISAFSAMKDKPKWSVECLDEPRLQTWLKALAQRDPPLHHGLLGVQPQGQLVTGYFVLFRDRLDFWNSTTEATSGDRPKGRINLTDIRGLEMVNSGFVLNYKGRKMGLHVRNNDELHEWSGALLGALAPAQGGTGRGSGNLGGGAKDRPKSAPPKVGKIDKDVLDRMRKQLQEMIPNGGDAFAVFAQRDSDMISTTELARMIFKKNGAKSQMIGKTEVQDFILAMAGNGSDRIKVTKLINFIENGAMPGKGNTHQMVPRVARLAEEKQRIQAENGTLGQTDIKDSLLRRRTYGGFAQEVKTAEQLAKNISPKPIAVRTHDKCRRDGGGAWKDNAVCAKVTVLEPGDQERKTVDREMLAKDKPLAEKTTGERVLTPRMQPGSLDWVKVTHCSQDVFSDPERSRQHGPRGNEGNHTKIGEENRKPIQPRTCLTEKVTDPGRRPLMDSDYKKAMADRMAEKVTDAGRTGAGWAAPFAEANADKCRSLAQRMGASKIGPVGGYPLYH